MSYYYLYVGKPGTGKSYTLKELYNQNKDKFSIQVICPTNQLVQNYLNQGIDQCSTLYNLMNLTPKSIVTRYRELNQPKDQTQNKTQSLDQQLNKIQTQAKVELKQVSLFLIDEVFMLSYVDMFVLYKTYPSSQFIFFGDPFQLKFVTSTMDDELTEEVKGLYWYDVFGQEKINIIQLNTLYRFKEDNRLEQFINDLYNYYKERVKKILNPKQDLNQDPDQDLKLNIKSNVQSNVITKYQNQDSNQNLNQDLEIGSQIDIQSNLNQNPNLDPKYFTTHLGTIFEIISPDKIPNLVEKNFVVIVGKHDKKQAYYNKILFYFKKQNLTFCAADGKLYYYGQPLYTVNRFQTLQELYYIHSYDEKTKVFTLVKNRDDLSLDDLSNVKSIKVEPKLNNCKYSYYLTQGNVLTVNVAQGREYEGVIIDMKNLFEYGSFYTAVSRCKKIEQIKIVNLCNLSLPDISNEFILEQCLRE